MAVFNTLLGIAGSMAANAYNQNTAKANAQAAYNRQQALMGIQQQYAVENWNREANYNSPVEQMKR